MSQRNPGPPFDRPPLAFTEDETGFNRRPHYDDYEDLAEDMDTRDELARLARELKLKDGQLRAANRLIDEMNGRLEELHGHNMSLVKKVTQNHEGMSKAAQALTEAL